MALAKKPVPLEAVIKKAVKKRLNFIGAYHFWPVQTGMGIATLDCIGCYKGKFFGIETKRPGGKPTARQLLTIEEMQAAGAIVMVVDNVEDANNLFGWSYRG